MKARYFWTGLAALAVAASAAAQDAQKKIQCWTDKNGQRMCGDRVPPEYAGQKRDVIKDGRVVDTVRAARTPEEAAEEARKKKEADEARKRADYDRALLESYRSARDIEVMRDERVALIDGRLRSAEKNAADTDRGLEGLRARADALTKENQPVDDKLEKQIKQFEKAQQQNQKALERYRKEREDLVQKFNHDLARYNELRPPAAAPHADKPGAAPAPPPVKAENSGS
jgi:DNA repair exonuclease SbcCD ATPase subunit